MASFLLKIDRFEQAATPTDVRIVNRVVDKSNLIAHMSAGQIAFHVRLA